MLRWKLNHQMDVSRHQMAFNDPALLLPCQFVKGRAECLPDVPTQHLAAVFGNKDDMGFAIQHRVGQAEFPPEIRRVIYTTNAIESLNFSLRKVIKNRSLFPSDEAVFKLLYLALRNAAKKWTMPIKDWPRALQMFAIIFEGRVPLP